jgi:hypothetical protein
MRRSALLCWEFGRGLGHAIPLAALARHLQAGGWRCVLALRLDQMPPGARVDGLTVCPSPGVAEGGPVPSQTARPATMGDILADLGLQSADWVRRRIADWQSLFAAHRPDLIVTDYAPGAILAARGRLPCLATGTGYVVPPAGLPRFPRLHDRRAILHDEEAVLAAVNAAAATFGSEPLASLAEAMTGDAGCVCTLPFLDPYAELRRDPVLGPLLHAPVEPRRSDAEAIFCYLRNAPDMHRLDRVVDCLPELPAPVVAYLPELAAADRQRLRNRGVRVLDDIAPLTETLAQCRLLVHSGGHGLASAAVLAGVPQVIVHFDIEKWLTAQALERRGVAHRFGYFRVEPEALRAGILSALDDPVMEEEAGRTAAEHAAYRDRDVVADVAAACERLAA